MQALGKSGVMLMDLPLRILPSKTAILPVSKELMPRSQEDIERCSRTVYVANIDKKVNKEDVRSFFEELCGEWAGEDLDGGSAQGARTFRWGRFGFLLWLRLLIACVALMSGACLVTQAKCHSSDCWATMLTPHASRSWSS